MCLAPVSVVVVAGVRPSSGAGCLCARRPASAPSRDPLPPLDRIVPAHIAHVRLLLSRYPVKPAHWREDLVQEILLEAHRSRGSRLDVRALLSGITRHVVLDWWERRRAERLLGVLHAGIRDVIERSAEDDWHAREQIEILRAAIDRLPESEREVFRLTQVEDVPMPGAARRLGIPTNTGYTRLHLARSRLRESLRRAATASSLTLVLAGAVSPATSTGTRATG